MTDNLTKQITTMIEIITAQSSATPIEKSVIGLLSDCRHEVDLANAEIERLREALRDAMQYLYDMGDFDKADKISAALGEGKE